MIQKAQESFEHNQQSMQLRQKLIDINESSKMIIESMQDQAFDFINSIDMDEPLDSNNSAIANDHLSTSTELQTTHDSSASVAESSAPVVVAESADILSVESSAPVVVAESADT